VSCAAARDFFDAFSANVTPSSTTTNFVGEASAIESTSMSRFTKSSRSSLILPRFVVARTSFRVMEFISR
jgi:hypothetical protein